MTLLVTALLACVVPQPRDAYTPLERDLPPRLSVALRMAFPIAVKHVRDLPECAELFGHVGLGDKALRYSLFLPGDPKICKATNAYTVKGVAIIFLCPVLESYPSESIAVTLIHESLHVAGMDHGPTYLESVAWSHLIASRCRLVAIDQVDQ